jgi:hypothetical protein
VAGSCSGASSGCKRWVDLLGGIIGVVLELGTWWAPNVGINSRRLFIPEHGGEWISAKVWKTREG